MALPPEPIDEMLPLADDGVVADITQIVHRDPQTHIPTVTHPGEVDLPRDLPAQHVNITITEVLFGSHYRVGQQVIVLKPAGDYVLRAGISGPLLLAHSPDKTMPTILGRYGPDTWSLSVLRAAIAKHGKKTLTASTT